MRRRSGSARTLEVTVVANTADDLWLHGLKVCPDLDTVMYTLGEGIDHERGWGRRDETWSVKEELAAYGAEATWFGLGDRDIATHLVRTQMLEAGYPLSQVTEALCRRWLAPVFGTGVRLLPMSDDRVETHVAIADGGVAERHAGVVHFQEYWVRLHAAVPAETVVVVGLEASTPAPGVLEAIADADVVVVPPSNPVVSVGTILGVPGIREALSCDGRRRSWDSPPSSAAPTCAGWRSSCSTVHRGRGLGGRRRRHYGARARDGVLDGWLVDTVDAGLVTRVEQAGLVCRAVPLLMTDVDATAAMAARALDLVS